MFALKKRIFFGHQSVGSNILDGMKNILSDDNDFRPIETRTPGEVKGTGFYHCRVGTNQDPISKINDFVSLMNNGFGKNVDIACFKFCYIDIQESSDVTQLFETYQTAMQSLEETYKNTTFLHVTVPLRTIEPGIRRFAKQLLGKQSIAIIKNYNRQNFNDLMIKTYGPTGRIFDLAEAESTFPNGKRCKGRYGSHSVYALVPQYSDDGGHLNNLGKNIVAEKFLDALERVAKN